MRGMLLVKINHEPKVVAKVQVIEIKGKCKYLDDAMTAAN